MAPRIPDNVRDEIITSLYRQAADIDWHLLSQGDKARWYTTWVDAPEIGGRLKQFLDPAKVRVWIKDVPMKEFARAEEGVGPYARYVTQRFDGAEEIVKRTLGKSWTVVPGTAGIKPQHCLVIDTEAGAEDTTRYMCWGNQKSFSTLVWAALQRAIAMRNKPLTVVVTRDSETVSSVDQLDFEKIGTRCGIEVRYLRREVKEV
ncbi:hypothetical protein GCM10009839_27800 [Catenulispora yoronensis]|uniref:Uncharacterized protein n=1 Tax=Catenulispora yoronensis TaxID=450799 RepID=A0ABN2U1R4_9ACTN